MNNNNLPSELTQALKNVLGNIIPEIAHNGDTQTVEEWAQAITFDIDRNELGRDSYGNLVYGIARDETVQDILALVTEMLNEMFDEYQPNMRRTEAHGQYLPY
jgi:hypothetical protein